mgnify:CR=1 FL=1
MKFLAFLSLIFLSANAAAKPSVSGDFLTQFKTDRASSSKLSGVPTNNAYFYAESNINLNFNKNWSIKSNWRLMPGNSLTTRDTSNPERYRSFLSSDRGFKPESAELIIEELKLDFQNDDLGFFIGKFDPTFGTAYNKKKRIGVFTSEFAEDYNLREKLGAGVTAFLENSKITVNSFFNDTTGLSESALSNRGRAPKSSSISGNTGTMSSYSASMDGDTLFGVEDLFYNFGYRSLGVDNKTLGKKREIGYVAGLEYLYRIGYKTSIIPFFEATKIKNFGGIEGRDATYSTTALIGKYSNWTTSISLLTRRIKNNPSGAAGGKQLQVSVGYKFTDNLAFDITRSNMKENSYDAALIGMMLTYYTKF